MSIILVIAPHPDDEVLGCGGTLKKHALAGDRVHLCIATKAYTPEWTQAFMNQRKQEIQDANKVLGIEKTYTLDFPTVKLDTIGQKKLNDAIETVVQDVKPDIVYIPFSGDLNKDHRLVHEACLVALRPFSAPFVEKVLTYETVSETEWGTSSFQPNVYSDITATLPSKIRAMRKYKSEVRTFPHPRSVKVLEALAIKRGSEANMRAAEAFILVRSRE